MVFLMEENIFYNRVEFIGNVPMYANFQIVFPGNCELSWLL